MDLTRKCLRSAGAAQTSHSQCPCRQRPEVQKRIRSATISKTSHFHTRAFGSGTSTFDINQIDSIEPNWRQLENKV